LIEFVTDEEDLEEEGGREGGRGGWRGKGTVTKRTGYTDTKRKDFS